MSDEENTQEIRSAGTDDSVPLTPELANRLFTYRDGKRYRVHGDKSYFLPDDESEGYRLLKKDLAIRSALRGRLHTTPCTKFERVLNLGCGPGYWVIDFADAYPDCEVVGVDVVPIQPDEIPPNATFECDDVLTGLNYPDNHFDMIAASVPTVTYTLENLHVFFTEVLRLLKPGGYINCIDFVTRPQSQTTKQFDSFNHWCETCENFYHSVGMRPGPFAELIPCLTATGFRNITQHPFMIPGGTSLRDDPDDVEAARHMTELTMLTISIFSNLPQYQAILGLDDEHMQLFMSEVRRETLDPEHVWQSPWMSMVAQKPS